jgi:F-type H+-transporting ATPase subunit epsilon
MAAKSFKLSIVTPERTLYEGDVTSVILPASDGYLGIWANHAPMVAAMRAGVVAMRERGRETTMQLYAVDQGFAEVSDNNVIVLADAARAEGEIDYDEVRTALDRRKAELREHLNDPDFDPEAAQRQIELEQAMLKVGYLRGSRD